MKGRSASLGENEETLSTVTRKMDKKEVGIKN